MKKQIKIGTILYDDTKLLYKVNEEVGMRITDTYSKDLTEMILSQFDFEGIRRSYHKCENLDHGDTPCRCKEIYDKLLTQEEFEGELYRVINEFIEN